MLEYIINAVGRAQENTESYAARIYKFLEKGAL